MENPILRWFRRLGATRQILVVALAVLIAGAFLLWMLPAWLTLHPRVKGLDRHKAISDARTGIAAFLAVLGTAAGLSYTARTYRLTRRGQIADRYTKAIDQLSSPDQDIRIGGIYALEQAARDDPEYRQTVVDVLSAYIRNRAPWPDPASQAPAHTGHRERTQALPVSPASDIQVALAVLRRQVPLSRTRGLDLSESNLSGADLQDMYLLDARLTGANLRGARLNSANLRGADLRGAELQSTQLYKADLTDARLWRGQVASGTLNQISGLDRVQWFDPPPGVDASPASPRQWSLATLWRRR